MPKYKVTLGSNDYQVDAPDPDTAWAWANSYVKSPEAKERTYGEAAQDIGGGLLSGIGQLGQFPGQLYGLATGNFDKTGLYGAAQNLEEYGKSLESPGLKARQYTADQAIQQASKKGILSEAGTAIAQTVKDPALLTNFILEQVPSQLPAVLAGIFGPEASAGVAGLRTLAKKATDVAVKKELENKAKELAIKTGTRAAVGTGAIQQGADVGAQTYKDVYDELIARDATPEQAAKGAIDLARAAGASGAIISLLAQNLPGAQAMERAFAGERTGLGRIAGAGLGALKEIPSEMIEEGGGQFTQNLAKREVNPNQSLTQGVGTSIGMAGLGAGVMGGVTGALAGKSQPGVDINLTNIPADQQQTQQTQQQAPDTNRALQDLLDINTEKPLKEEKKEKPGKVIRDQNFKPTAPIDSLEALDEKIANAENVVNHYQQMVDDKTYKSPDHLKSIQKIIDEHRRQLDSYKGALAQRLTNGEERAKQPIDQSGGAGVGVPSGSSTNIPTTTGTSGTTTTRVVSTGENVPSAIAGEGNQPVALTPPKEGETTSVIKTPSAPEKTIDEVIKSYRDDPDVAASLIANDLVKQTHLNGEITRIVKTYLTERADAGRAKLKKEMQDPDTGFGLLGLSKPEMDDYFNELDKYLTEKTALFNENREGYAGPNPKPPAPPKTTSAAPAKSIVNSQIKKQEDDIGKRYDEERDLSRFADDQSINLYEATSKGALPADQQLGSARLNATLKANGLTEPELSDDYDEMSPEEKDKERKRVIDEIATQLEGKRNLLPAWGDKSLTRDAKDVYLANMKSNTPAQREKARAALLDYLNKLREVQGTGAEIKAAPEAGIYERNRQAYKAKDKLEYPTWDQLNDDQRKTYNDKLAELAPKNKKNEPVLNKATAEHHDQAFKAVADKLVNEGYVPKPGMTYADVRDAQLKQSEKVSHERAQKEIETDTIEKEVKAEMANEVTATNTNLPGRGIKFLPDSLISQLRIKEGAIQNLLNYLTNVTTNKNYRAIAKEIQKLGLKTKIQIVEKIPKQHRAGDAVAVYDPKTDTIITTSEGLQDEAMMHEVVHAATTNVIYKYLNFYKNGKASGLSLDQIEAVEHLENIMEVAKEELGEIYPDAFKDLYEFVSYAMTNKSFQNDLKETSNENLDNTMIPESKSLWSEFMLSVVKTLGALKDFFAGKKPGEPLGNLYIEAISGFEKILSPPPDSGINLKTLAITKAATPAAGTAAAGPRNMDQLLSTRKTAKEPTRPSLFRLLSSQAGRTEIVKKLQNWKYAAKIEEDARVRSNRVIDAGPDINNAYTQSKMAGGRAVHMYNTQVAALDAKAKDLFGQYIEKTGLAVEKAVQKINLYLQAFHEAERREILFMKNVPLSNTAVSIHGKMISPSDFRNKVINLVEGNKVSKVEAKKLGEELRKIVNDPKYQDSSNGFSPAGHKGKESVNIDNDMYKPTDLSAKERDTVLDDYKNNEQNKATVEELRKTLDAILEKTKELNKISGHWSEPVDKISEFYGWKNYVPYKGPKVGKNEASLDLDYLNFSAASIGVLQEYQNEFVGGNNIPGDILTQILADANRAASRAALHNLTLAVKNLVQNPKNEFWKGKVTTIPFIDRKNTDLGMYKGKPVMFHYNINGDLDIISVEKTSSNLFNAVRKTYSLSNPIIDRVNTITSTIGMGHTRYNVAFAPVNFVRDAMMNSLIMTIDTGGIKYPAQYVWSMATKVATGGLFKVGKAMYLYNKADTTAFDNYVAKDKTGFLSSMKEYLGEGGDISFLDSITTKGKFQNLEKDIKKGTLRSLGQYANTFFDTYSAMFELTSRTAAYQAMKAHYKNDPDYKNKSDEAIRVRAAAQVKGLANFEETGEWGKGLGAVFMFARPAATGAVRSMEALGPMFRSTQAALETDLDPALQKDPDAVAKFKANHERQRKMAQATTVALLGMGMAIYFMSQALADDDDMGRNKVASDDINRWTRYARFFIPGMDTPVQLPWAYGPGAFAAAGAQIAAVIAGNASIKDAMSNIVGIGGDSFLPIQPSRISMFDNPAAWFVDTIMPSPIRPFVEYVMNTDALGREIYNNRNSKYADAYTGGDNIPEMWKDTARFMSNNFGIDISPNTLYFFANNYADGITRIGQDSYNLGLIAFGQKEFNPKTDTVFFDSFFGAKSNYDAREFSKIENKIKDMQKQLNTLEEANPERYEQYIIDNPMDEDIVEAYKSGIGGDLKALRKEANEIRLMPGLTPKERSEMLKGVIQGENIEKWNLVNQFKAMGVD